jgi:hypothetical protein
MIFSWEGPLEQAGAGGASAPACPPEGQAQARFIFLYFTTEGTESTESYLYYDLYPRI